MSVSGAVTSAIKPAKVALGGTLADQVRLFMDKVNQQKAPTTIQSHIMNPARQEWEILQP
jgi:hypothetical protein